MMSRKIFFSILLVFLILAVLFLFSALSSEMLSRPDTNDRGGEISTLSSGSAFLSRDFNLGPGTAADTAGAQSGGETAAAHGAAADGAQTPQAAAVAGNPYAVLIAKEGDGVAVLEEWCTYNKYRYRAFTAWPDVSALNGASVVMVGDMDYSADVLPRLTAYAQTGIPLLFTALPDFAVLSASPELADFFGILACVEPACRVDGVKVFADFFLSKERIYETGDFYGEADDTQFVMPYYTLRVGYESYVVGLLNDQRERGIENEALPTLLWRTYTGRSQVYVVNTDLFDGEMMLGVLTAFLSSANDWYLYPVVNARTVMMTDYPFLSNENSGAMQSRYSRDTLGFERDIVWPNVVKVFNNYQAVPNFFVSTGLDYGGAYAPLTDDLNLYWKQIKGQGGTIGLSLMQSTRLTIGEIVKKVTGFFAGELPDFRFFAAYGGDFSDDAWRQYLQSGQNDILSELSLVLSSYREGRPMFSFLNDRVLSVLMTTNGFAHETMDDLQLISLMTALGYYAQQVDMDRALFPAGDADDWSNLSVLWSKGDTYYRDYAKFENTSVYGMEARVRRLLGSNYNAARDGDTLQVSVDPFDEQMWFVLRVHGETVTAVSGGEATRISEYAYLIRVDRADAEITLAKTHALPTPD